MNNEKMSTTGVIIKSLFGLFIVFSIALPRIARLEVLFTGLMGLLFAIGLGILWYMLFMSLKQDRGSLINMIVYIATCVILGLFFSNTIVVSIYLIDMYSDGALNPQMVQEALQLASLATMIAVLGGIVVLPKIKLSDKVAKVGLNMMGIFSALLIGYGIMFMIAFVLSIFNITFLLDALLGLFYGTSIFSIGISAIMVLVAEALFLASLARVKLMIGKEEKYLEYFGAIVLVNAIVQIFIEIFKLILKMMARKNR